MQLFEQILSCYGWEGAALAGATLLMLGVQLYYYIFVYGRIPGYKNKNRINTAYSRGGGQLAMRTITRILN